jgi:hypothetical protein
MMTIEEVMHACRGAGLTIAGPSQVPGVEGVVVCHGLDSPKLKVLNNEFRLIPSGPKHTIVQAL